jgi:hypothetical protein
MFRFFPTEKAKRPGKRQVQASDDWLAVRHLQYMTGRHARDKRVRSAHPTRVSHAAGAASRAHPMQML